MGGTIAEAVCDFCSAAWSCRSFFFFWGGDVEKVYASVYNFWLKFPPSF